MPDVPTGQAEEATNDFAARVRALELALIEREHRLLALLQNLVRFGIRLTPEEKHSQTGRLRQRAAWIALIYYLVSPGTVAAVSIPILSVAALIVALHANQLLDYQNGLQEVERSPAVFAFHRWDANLNDKNEWVVEVTWKIENTGQGPAEVRAIQWRPRGGSWEPLEKSRIVDDVETLLLAACDKEFLCAISGFQEDLVTPGYVIRADENYVALSLALTVKAAEPLTGSAKPDVAETSAMSVDLRKKVLKFAQSSEVVDFQICVCPLSSGRERPGIVPFLGDKRGRAYQCHLASTAETSRVVEPTAAPCGTLP